MQLQTQKKIRLDKALAHIGIGSRREIKELVKKACITINGTIAKKSDIQIDVDDIIVVNGVRAIYREHIYLMMNKPAGLLSATEDRKDEVVIDLLTPEHQAFAPFPVGRLDKDTEGLLIITNDGNLAHRLLSPRSNVPKLYYARIEGKVEDADSVAFAGGIVLDDGYTALPAKLKILRSDCISEIEVTVYEGKFHQVKRMFAAVGKKVVYLKRLAMGSLQLDQSLELGTYRELNAAEVDILRQSTEDRD